MKNNKKYKNGQKCVINTFYMISINFYKNMKKWLPIPILPPWVLEKVKNDTSPKPFLTHSTPFKTLFTRSKKLKKKKLEFLWKIMKSLKVVKNAKLSLFIWFWHTFIKTWKYDLDPIPPPWVTQKSKNDHLRKPFLTHLGVFKPLFRGSKKLVQKFLKFWKK